MTPSFLGIIHHLLASHLPYTISAFPSILSFNPFHRAPLSSSLMLQSIPLSLEESKLNPIRCNNLITLSTQAYQQDSGVCMCVRMCVCVCVCSLQENKCIYVCVCVSMLPLMISIPIYVGSVLLSCPHLLCM